MIEISHRQQVLLVIAFMLVVFAWLAKLDYVLGERPYVAGIQYHLPFITVGSHWMYMWVVGYPLLGFLFAFAYFAGAEDTPENLWYAVGIFATFMLLAFGQLEDFFFFIVNGLAFPSGDWSIVGWNAENNIWYKLAGTWQTWMHFTVLISFIAIVVVMWIAIFELTLNEA